MKKAYVKPVFFAEEYVAETSYAASACGASKYEAFVLTAGMDLCPESDNGHYVGGNQGNKGTVFEGTWHYNTDATSYTNWQYATQGDSQATIFMDTDCDFWWDPNTGSNGSVFVWNNVNEDDRTEKYTDEGNNKWGFMGFFGGNNADHVVAFEGTKVPQS